MLTLLDLQAIAEAAVGQQFTVPLTRKLTLRERHQLSNDLACTNRYTEFEVVGDAQNGYNLIITVTA